MKTLLLYYKPYKTILSSTLLGAVVISVMELCFPMYLRYILNTILPTGDMQELMKNAVILFSMYMLAVYGNYVVMLKGRTIGALIERDMRKAIFKHVESMSFSFFDNQRVGQLVSRIVGDVGEIREIIFLGPNYLIVCIIFMIGTIAMLFSINWKLAILVNLLLVFKAIDSVITNRKLKVAGRAARKETGNISAFTTESLSAIRIVQAFDNASLEAKKLDEFSARLLKARKNNFNLLGHSNSSMVF